MKLVFASDSFKGTLTNVRIGELLAQAAREVLPGVECVAFQIADEGEGTLDAIRAAREGEQVAFPAHDGLMRPVRGEIFICDGTAFVEVASTCGLTLLESDERDPLATTSYGVGECIRFALEQGCGEVVVGLGGSCTNDGGMGLSAVIDASGGQALEYALAHAEENYLQSAKALFSSLRDSSPMRIALLKRRSAAGMILR